MLLYIQSAVGPPCSMRSGACTHTQRTSPYDDYYFIIYIDKQSSYTQTPVAPRLAVSVVPHTMCARTTRQAKAMAAATTMTPTTARNWIWPNHYNYPHTSCSCLYLHSHVCSHTYVHACTGVCCAWCVKYIVRTHARLQRVHISCAAQCDSSAGVRTYGWPPGGAKRQYWSAGLESVGVFGE